MPFLTAVATGVAVPELELDRCSSLSLRSWAPVLPAELQLAELKLSSSGGWVAVGGRLCGRVAGCVGDRAKPNWAAQPSPNKTTHAAFQVAHRPFADRVVCTHRSWLRPHVVRFSCIAVAATFTYCGRHATYRLPLTSNGAGFKEGRKQVAR